MNLKQASDCKFSVFHPKLESRNSNLSKFLLIYWTYTIFAGYLTGQEWLDDGILTNQSMEFIQCESMHMTAFSVLLDPSIGMLIPEKHKPILSIISYIGSVCSIFGLFLTILTYSMFR
jgi:hypothetical protein